MIGLAYLALSLHPFDQPRGIVVADAQLALDIAGRRFLAFGNDLAGFAVEFVFG